REALEDLVEEARPAAARRRRHEDEPGRRGIGRARERAPRGVEGLVEARRAAGEARRRPRFGGAAARLEGDAARLGEPLTAEPGVDQPIAPGRGGDRREREVEGRARLEPARLGLLEQGADEDAGAVEVGAAIGAGAGDRLGRFRRAGLEVLAFFAEPGEIDEDRPVADDAEALGPDAADDEPLVVNAPEDREDLEAEGDDGLARAAAGPVERARTEGSRA